jgi:hypothetical protein
MSAYCQGQDSSEIDDMQSWGGCATIETPTSDTASPGVCLTDTRDGKVYQVRKFPDGKCWMVENLRYGGSTANAGAVVDYCLGRDSSPTSTLPEANTNWFVAAGGTGTTDNLYGDCNDPAIKVDTCAGTTQCGYRYIYQAVMQNARACNIGYDNPTYCDKSPSMTTGDKGICPTGWRVFTLADFTTVQGNAALQAIWLGGISSGRWWTSNPYYYGTTDAHYVWLYNNSLYSGDQVHDTRNSMSYTRCVIN